MLSAAVRVFSASQPQHAQATYVVACSWRFGDPRRPRHQRSRLTEGRFGAGSGFDVADQIVATLLKDWLARAELAHEAKTPIALALSWSIE